MARKSLGSVDWVRVGGECPLNGCVSVVVPARNEESHIEACIRSIRVTLAEGGVQNSEIVVVDDASTDLTSEIAIASGARVIRHREQRGVLSAWASGMGATRGELVLFVDADCLVSEDAFSALRDSLRDARVGVACGRSEPFGRRSATLIHSAGEFSSNLLHSVKSDLVDHAFLPIGRLMLLRREAWNVEREDQFPCDWIVGLGALLKGWGVVYVPSAVVMYAAPASVGESYSDWLRTRKVGKKGAPSFTSIPRLYLLVKGLRVVVAHPASFCAWLLVRCFHYARYLTQPTSGTVDWSRWGRHQ